MQFQLSTILLALGLVSQAAALNCYATLDICNWQCGDGEFPCSETSGAPAEDDESDVYMFSGPASAHPGNVAMGYMMDGTKPD
ncbi:hypothetical protein BO78DRAFT_422094 [Aspergillus sclerotiicarbonarius CBS 121057]|uniref:Uncharacterized protein n=1 Tax=Aspergillus sclerotiicarbonarius (strain CBS 121057 / IBT 28362) TaxID=1448318 RepID=A0A319EGS6_ASPSB|nr:hypothetical protein BO78DRAFT_422094 [Aspergillus sclerotiicarbonarius CBS 121057]